MDLSPCFQQCLLHFAHFTQGNYKNCSVLQLSRFGHRGVDPLLTLSEHLLYTAFCLLHVSLFAQGKEGTYAVYCRCQNFSIDWDGSLFTDFTFHVIDCFSISSLQLLWSIKRLTLIWVIFRLSRISRDPQFHRSTNLPVHRSTNRRVNRPTLVCLSLRTVCCRPHFAHCTIKRDKNWYCELLCQFLVLCDMVHFCIVSIVKRV